MRAAPRSARSAPTRTAGCCRPRSGAAGPMCTGTRIWPGCGRSPICWTAATPWPASRNCWRRGTRAAASAGCSGSSPRCTGRGPTSRPTGSPGTSCTGGSAVCRTTRRSPRRSSSECWSRSPDATDEFLVPSPQELSVAVELHAAGVPLTAISGHLRELRGQVEHIASRFLEFTTEHVFARYLGHRPPTDADAAEAAELVRRLRPLAQQTVDAELARAMRTFATRHLQHHLGADAPIGSYPARVSPVPCCCPPATMRAVQTACWTAERRGVHRGCHRTGGPDKDIGCTRHITR